jgi:hypothetical protein
MKQFNWRIPLGIAAVALGVVALLQNFDLISLQGGLALAIFGVIFAAIGASFTYALIADHNAWWAAIPGLTLLGLGVMMILLAVAEDFLGNFPPALFMGSIAASFWLIYALKRFWWAIIPAGVLTTIAIIILVPDQGNLVASILFLGMAATFALLGFIAIDGRRMTWPWIPAGILALMGIIFGLTTSGITGLVWAVLLILAGVFLVARPYLLKR